MNELEKSFAAAKVAKDRAAQQIASLESQSSRFWTLFRESVQAHIEEINGKPELCKQARGPLKTREDEDGYQVYVSTFPVIHIAYKNHGNHITVDLYRKEHTSDFNQPAHRVKSERYSYELGSDGVVQVRTKDGQIFSDEGAFALHVLEPFWALPR